MFYNVVQLRTALVVTPGKQRPLLALWKAREADSSGAFGGWGVGVILGPDAPRLFPLLLLFEADEQVQNFLWKGRVDESVVMRFERAPDRVQNLLIQRSAV
jgi:hypothetical protein